MCVSCEIDVIVKVFCVFVFFIFFGYEIYRRYELARCTCAVCVWLWWGGWNVYGVCVSDKSTARCTHAVRVCSAVCVVVRDDDLVEICIFEFKIVFSRSVSQ